MSAIYFPKCSMKGNAEARALGRMTPISQPMSLSTPLISFLQTRMAVTRTDPWTGYSFIP